MTTFSTQSNTFPNRDNRTSTVCTSRRAKISCPVPLVMAMLVSALIKSSGLPVAKQYNHMHTGLYFLALAAKQSVLDILSVAFVQDRPTVPSIHHLR